MLKVVMLISILAICMQLSADQLYHDLRCVADVAHFSFDEITDDEANSWVLIRVTPGSFSGAATIPGAYVKAETGEIVKPRNKAVVIVKKGSWKLITAINKHPETDDGFFEWTEPMAVNKRKFESRDIYCPFSKGGSVLCRYNPKATGSMQFSPSYLVPAGWGATVKTAYEYFQKQPDLFRGIVTQSNHGRLFELVHGNNPVLSVVAFRQLVKNKNSSHKLTKSSIERSEGYLQAIFTYTLVVYFEKIDADKVVEHLRGVIDATVKPKQLRPIALGVFTAMLFHPGNPIQALCRDLLVALRERSAKLSPDGAATDEYLLVILNKAGVMN